jgi:serine/threonine-protein phosphatase with EF-hand domain
MLGVAGYLVFQKRKNLVVKMALRRGWIATSRRALSTWASSENSQSVARDGAWTLLAALEKAKEAEGVKVARLVSSLELLLPHTDLDTPLHTTPQQHTNDPAFFSLMDPNNVTKTDIVSLLRATRRGKRINTNTVEALVTAATKYFEDIPTVVSLPPLRESQRLTVIGDLHGSLSDLEAVLGLTGDPGRNNILLFNGDLADRGDHGVEVICAVCALTLAFPGHVFVNRGNHEDLALSVAYGLALEVQHKYGTPSFRNRLAPLLDHFFRSLPLVTVVEDDVIIVHGGPPPPGITIDNLRTQLSHSPGCGLSRTVRIHNVQETQDDGCSSCSEPNAGTEEVIEALLWSDPDIHEEDGTLVDHGQDTGRRPNVSRGAGYKFDAGILKKFLRAEGLSRFVRSHEPVSKGCSRYIIDSAEQMELFTVFSASRYPYKEGFNWGAVLTLQSHGRHNIVRYSTEDDDVVVTHLTEEPSLEHRPQPRQVDSFALRRALGDVVANKRLELSSALDAAASSSRTRADNMPFDQAIDVLVRVLNLQGEGLSQPGPRLALAKALSHDCSEVPPATIHLLEALDELGENDDYSCSVHRSWLKAVFTLVDANHDGVVSKAEWMAAVETINANLPSGSEAINAQDTWSFLDSNGDGSVSAAEWGALAMSLCR